MMFLDTAFRILMAFAALLSPLLLQTHRWGFPGPDPLPGKEGRKAGSCSAALPAPPAPTLEAAPGRADSGSPRGRGCRRLRREALPAQKDRPASLGSRCHIPPGGSPLPPPLLFLLLLLSWLNHQLQRGSSCRCAAGPQMRMRRMKAQGLEEAPPAARRGRCMAGRGRRSLA